MNRKHGDKEINKYLKQLISEGWTMKPGHKGHFKMRSPKGYNITISSSPHCWYALDNVKKDVARIREKEKQDEQV